MDGFSVGLDVARRTAALSLRTGVVGAGVFGGYHAAKLASSPGSRFQGVADPDLSRAEAVASRHGGQAFADVDALIDACDALIIAAPAVHHAKIAARAIEAGRHVLVEKPLASTPQDADMLVRLAHRHGVVLQAGHQERFVMDALGLLRTPEAPLSIECVREGPGSGRGCDVSVTMDLMIHDLDLVATFFGASPLNVTARGFAENGGPFDEVEATLTFAAGVATLKSSRIAPERRRTMTAAFAKGDVAVDFVNRTFRNDAGLPLDEAFASRVPDPLGASVEAFLAAAAGHAPCPVPGEAGAAAVRLAAAVDAAAGRRV
jgi:predicted dehydrogenase